MENDQKTLWSKIEISQPVDDLAKHGPTVEVAVGAIERGQAFRVLAQIDTGAFGTGISIPFSHHLKLVPVAWGELHQPGLPPRKVPYFRVRLSLPFGDIEIDIVGLSTLDPPHDVLIGRDVLARCRLTVDFTTGITEFHIKASETAAAS